VLEFLEERLTPTNILVTDPAGTAGSATDVTLRYAVVNAQNGDSIAFSSSLSGDTITLGSVLTISHNVTITGLGAGNLAISGGGTIENFFVNTGVTASISNLTIKNGLAGTGGGIYNNGTLTLSNAILSGNSAGNLGGGIFSGSGSSLTLINDTLSGNRSHGSGGGIFTDGTLTLSNSTLSSNSASQSGSSVPDDSYGFGGGIYNNGGTATLSNATLSGNLAADTGGGIINRGTMTLSNATLSGNKSYNGGGGIVNVGTTLTLSNSTLSGNSAVASNGGFGGGGILNDGPLTLVNTIVAGNSDSTSPDIVNFGPSISSTNSLIGNGSGSGISNGTNGNQVGVSTRV